MKAVYLNVKESKAAEVIEVEDNLDTYYRLLDCSCIDVAVRMIGDKYYDIVCDDEGLLVEEPILSAIDEYGDVQLVGNLLVCKHDHLGEFVGLTDEEIKEVLNAVQRVYTRSRPDGYYVLKTNY